MRPAAGRYWLGGCDRNSVWKIASCEIPGVTPGREAHRNAYDNSSYQRSLPLPFI